jgi:hypothetical protein
MMSRPVSREPAGGGGRPAAAAGRPPEGKAPPVIERGEDRLAHGAAGEGPRAGRRAGAGNLTIVRDGQRPSTWLPSTRAATRLPAAVRRRDSVPAARTCPIREGTGQHRRAATRGNERQEKPLERDSAIGLAGHECAVNGGQREPRELVGGRALRVVAERRRDLCPQELERVVAYPADDGLYLRRDVYDLSLAVCHDIPVRL